MIELDLAVDVGGSSTKLLYQLRQWQEPKYLLVPPEVELIAPERFAEYQQMKGWIGSPSPEQEAWLELGNQIAVVGKFAAKFDPKDRLHELKYENALYKVLAGIGIIVQKHEMRAQKQLRVRLAILLPWNEYTDRSKFQVKLEKLLADYQFRGTRLKVKLETFLCRPEGGGLAVAALGQKGTGWLRNKRIAVLMLGHRNVTALYFEYGELKSGDSPLLGFNLFLERVCSLKSGLNRDTLATALFRARASKEAQQQIYQARGTYYPNWQELEEIKALATARDPELRQQEISQIHQALRTANQEYWGKLCQWFERVLPERLDEVIISGGAAHFLEPDLEEQFNCQPNSSYTGYSQRREAGYRVWDRDDHFTPIVWGHEIQFDSRTLEGILALNKGSGQEQALKCRLVDVYGLFVYLRAKTSQGAAV